MNTTDDDDIKVIIDAEICKDFYIGKINMTDYKIKNIYCDVNSISEDNILRTMSSYWNVVLKGWTWKALTKQKEITVLNTKTLTNGNMRVKFTVNFRSIMTSSIPNIYVEDKYQRISKRLYASLALVSFPSNSTNHRIYINEFCNIVFDYKIKSTKYSTKLDEKYSLTS